MELGVRENCVSCLFIVVMFIELDGTNKWGRHHLGVGASYKLGYQLLYGVLTSPATTKWLLSMSCCYFENLLQVSLGTVKALIGSYWIPLFTIFLLFRLFYIY